MNYVLLALQVTYFFVCIIKLL